MRQIVFLWYFIAFTFLIAIDTGCNTHQRNNDKLEFYYFPEKNLYYDVARKNYLYSLDGGKTWDSIKSPNNEDQGSLGKKEIIFADTDSVWLDNEAHRKLYSGSTYNIVNDDTSTTAAVNDVAEKKVTKKTKRKVVRKAVTEAEKKQPVRDFFRKLFGKHKKER